MIPYFFFILDQCAARAYAALGVLLDYMPVPVLQRKSHFKAPHMDEQKCENQTFLFWLKQMPAILHCQRLVGFFGSSDFLERTFRI